MKSIKSSATIILAFALLVCIGYIIELKTEPAFNKQEITTHEVATETTVTATPLTTPIPSASTYKTNINTAEFAELCKLKGIGEVTAQRIIDYRNEYGDFKSIEDVLYIQGVGEKTFELFKDNICVE